jgi:hypothetical protein
MTKFRIILSAGAMTALACAVPAVAHPDHSKTEEVRTIKIVKADGSHAGHHEIAADCGKGRKFESSSSTGDDKNKNVSKMVICSDPGESDAEWAATLRKALAEVEANGDIRGEGKAQIVADLRAEIAKVGK